MKTKTSKSKQNGTVAASALIARAAAAKKFAQLARQRLKSIKAEHKLARKAYKQAKKAARRARKEAKVAAQALKAKLAKQTRAAKPAPARQIRPAIAKAQPAPPKIVTDLPTANLPVELVTNGPGTRQNQTAAS
jgi:hypothetical protein